MKTAIKQTQYCMVHEIDEIESNNKMQALVTNGLEKSILQTPPISF